MMETFQDKYTALQNDITRFEENLKLMSNTNKLSFLISNFEIIKKWKNINVERFLIEYRDDFLPKFLPKEIIEKYKFRFQRLREDEGYRDGFFRLEISPKHDWVVKIVPNTRDSHITFFINGTTKATFTNEETSNDFLVIKEKSVEMVNEFRKTNSFLRSISSSDSLMPVWERMISESFSKYKKDKNITEINFSVPAGKIIQYKLGNEGFGPGRQPHEYGIVLETTTTIPQTGVRININKALSELLDNDAIKKGDVFEFDTMWVENAYCENPKISITKVSDNGKVIDIEIHRNNEKTPVIYTGKHVSFIVELLLKETVTDF